MASFLYKTRGNASPTGKPRVYFTCHPDDFERAFEKITDDILKATDCAIYYTESMSEPIPERERDVDLRQMNLFAVPVTFRLMHEPNRAMQEDIAFAKRENIPILPILMESGIDSIYAREENFGQRQYLDPFAADETAISYEEKLKKHLDAVLISDEMARRVRAAFDAYVFLSYRKKDRAYANELMRLIHKNPEYRDIAIWYDEFLTPGESFRENIDKMLESSQLFTLLVTPNLLEEYDGQPNFVMGEEYPAARRAGKEILPAEMEETDRVRLSEKFDGIPDCVKPTDEASFRSRLLNSIERMAIKQNDRDSAHNFLIGLAYLDGIDVEVDRPRALELITSAAEAELPEAMEKLYDMYFEGRGVSLDYREATKWMERLTAYCEKTYGEMHKQTLWALNQLSPCYAQCGDYQRAMEIAQKSYDRHVAVLGEEHEKTLSALGLVSMMHNYLGNFTQALELDRKVLALRERLLGEEHAETLVAYNNLSASYVKTGDYSKALETIQKAADISRRVFGEEDLSTLIYLNSLGTTYAYLGDYQKQFEILKPVYEVYCRVLGEENPTTLVLLRNIALAYGNLGYYQHELDLESKIYGIQYRVLGAHHPETITTLAHYAVATGLLGDLEKESELSQTVFAARYQTLGEDHPDTIESLSHYAGTLSGLGQHEKAIAMGERSWVTARKVFGDMHPRTLTVLSNLAVIYGEGGHYQKQLDTEKWVFAAQQKTLGQLHPDSLLTLSSLIVSLNRAGEKALSIELCEFLYHARCETAGPVHPDTQRALYLLCTLYRESGNEEKELEYSKIALKILQMLAGEDHPSTIELAERIDELSKNNP